MGSKKVRVQINYKSGLSMVIECERFAIKARHTFEWTDAVPNPLLLGADDIESVWQIA